MLRAPEVSVRPPVSDDNHSHRTQTIVVTRVATTEGRHAVKNKDHHDAGRSLAERWKRHQQMVRLGQVLMGIGAAIVLVHVIMHLKGNPSGWTDLIAGYPTGGLVAIVGAVLAGRRPPHTQR